MHHCLLLGGIVLIKDHTVALQLLPETILAYYRREGGVRQNKMVYSWLCDLGDRKKVAHILTSVSLFLVDICLDETNCYQ